MLPTWLFLACASAERVTRPPVPGSPRTVFLARSAPASLRLPDGPADAPPVGDEVPMAGPWVLERTVGGVAEYRGPLPVHGALVNRSSPSEGLVVAGPSGPVGWAEVEEKSPKAGTFAVAGPSVLLRLAASEGAPAEGAWTLRYPAAMRAERALRWKESGLDAAPFALREQTVRTVTRQGVFLPAPAEASWTLDVPAGATFSADLQVLPSAFTAGTPSDGASLAVDVVVEGTSERVGEWRAGPNVQPVQADLSRFAGKSVTLRLSSLPGAQASKDYVYCAEPAVYAASEHPRRLLVIFIDTLRPDHLGVFGYPRATSPNIDALAKSGVLFTQARAVSGWTLPSAQAALSGWLPHEFDAHPTVAERLSGLGFFTGAVMANTFVSPRFGLARGWGYYAVDPTVGTPAQVRRAIELIEAHAGRDLALLVHILDPHVPYEEPEPYRSRWAGAAPEGFPEKLDRGKLAAWLKARKLAEPDEATKAYVVARYDQEIAFVDEHLGPLLAAAGPDATVVLFSDHGEEFWDHGGFEHGHTQYDELLHVPLIVRSPDLEPATVDAPVSLLDIGPTLMELLGGATTDFAGTSLVAAARGDAAAAATLAARPQAFGWRLYDADRWGVLTGGLKWTTELGRQRVFDVRADADEARDLAASTDLDAFPGPFEAAAGFPVARAWSVRPGHQVAPIDTDVVLTVTTPGGFSRAWAAYDYRGEHDKNRFVHALVEGGVRITQPAGSVAPGEIFLLPARPLETIELTASLEVGGQRVEAVGTGALDFTRGATAATLEVAGERWRIGPVLTATPPETKRAAVNAETMEQIRALGYSD